MGGIFDVGLYFGGTVIKEVVYKLGDFLSVGVDS